VISEGITSIYKGRPSFPGIGMREEVKSAIADRISSSL
jgi:hypothetical protein